MSDITSSTCNEAANDQKILNRKKNARGALFLMSVAGMSIIGGFGFTIALAKKKDPSYFNKGLTGIRGSPESGGSLAVKALGYGTLYAVGGFSLFCFGILKLMGVSSMEEFRTKIQTVMPTVPKNELQGKSDFKTVREVFDYIIEEDRKAKETKGS